MDVELRHVRDARAGVVSGGGVGNASVRQCGSAASRQAHGGADALLVEVGPDVDDEHHAHQDAPAAERAEATREAPLVEQEADADGADDLREPVDEVVERTRTDVEQRGVEVVELCATRASVR